MFRASNREKLGLTLRYESDPHIPSECQCYIEAIDPQGVAGLCHPKLRVQDQVLQVSDLKLCQSERSNFMVVLHEGVAAICSFVDCAIT